MNQGAARIAGTRVKVMHLVMERAANKWDAEELRCQFQHLSLSQIYAALTYYYDHQSDIDAQIKASVEQADRMRQDAGESVRQASSQRWCSSVSVGLYMDEHVPSAITEGLRRRGVDVITVQDDGMDGSDDDVILDCTTWLGRVIFTRDQDFLT